MRHFRLSTGCSDGLECLKATITSFNARHLSRLVNSLDSKYLQCSTNSYPLPIRPLQKALDSNTLISIDERRCFFRISVRSDEILHDVIEDTSWERTCRDLYWLRERPTDTAHACEPCAYRFGRKNRPLTIMISEKQNLSALGRAICRVPHPPIAGSLKGMIRLFNTAGPYKASSSANTVISVSTYASPVYIAARLPGLDSSTTRMIVARGLTVSTMLST